LDDNILAHVAESCRHLRKLDMSGWSYGVSPSGIGALTSLKNTLQVLRMGAAVIAQPPDDHGCVVHDSFPPPMHVVAQLTSLQSLTMAMFERHSCPPARIDALSSLQHLTKVALQLAGRYAGEFLRAADVLPTLASLPLLVDLSLPEETVWDAESAARLHGMARLTALRLGFGREHSGDTDSDDDDHAHAGDDDQALTGATHAALVLGLAALPDLREVGLLRLPASSLSVLQSGLGSLPLRSLQVELDARALTSDAVAGFVLGAGVPAEHITRLAMSQDAQSFERGGIQPYLRAAELRTWAHVAKGLQALQLSRLRVPPNLFELLGGLECLRSLSVLQCWTTPGSVLNFPGHVELDYSKLSPLTQLTSFTWCCGSRDFYRGLGSALGCLTNLEELELGWIEDAGVVRQLLPLLRLRLLTLPMAYRFGVRDLMNLSLLPSLERVECPRIGERLSAYDIRSRLRQAMQL
jgi:hypothetical protein